MSANIRIRWTPHPRLSAIHAAYVVAGGSRCVDPKTEKLLVTPVTELNNRLLSASVDVGRFWRRLIVEVAGERVAGERVAGERVTGERVTGQRGDGDRSDSRAVEIALTDAGLSELQLEPNAQGVTRLIADCRSAYAAHLPKLADQLKLRAGPLKERWDAYGPGLLRAIAARIWDGSPPEDWWPPRIETLLMQPARGGAGGFDPDSQRVWIEAMLTDANPAVPEVLRVAWLISRVAIELHTREKSGEHSRRLPWPFASVPIVLAAAADLDLVAASPMPVRVAMGLWDLGDHRHADVVERWWSERERTGTPLPVSLKTLDEMLHPSDRLPLGGAVR